MDWESDIAIHPKHRFNSTEDMSSKLKSPNFIVSAKVVRGGILIKFN